MDNKPDPDLDGDVVNSTPFQSLNPSLEVTANWNKQIYILQLVKTSKHYPKPMLRLEHKP